MRRDTARADIVRAGIDRRAAAVDEAHHRVVLRLLIVVAEMLAFRETAELRSAKRHRLLRRGLCREGSDRRRPGRILAGHESHVVERVVVARRERGNRDEPVPARQQQHLRRFAISCVRRADHREIAVARRIVFEEHHRSLAAPPGDDKDLAVRFEQGRAVVADELRAVGHVREVGTLHPFAAVSLGARRVDAGVTVGAKPDHAAIHQSHPWSDFVPSAKHHRQVCILHKSFHAWVVSHARLMVDIGRKNIAGLQQHVTLLIIVIASAEGPREGRRVKQGDLARSILGVA